MVRSTKDLPPFIPYRYPGYELTPEVGVYEWLNGTQISVYVDGGVAVTGTSRWIGLDGLNESYKDVIAQLVNIAHYHYMNYLNSVGLYEDEERGTSFDDSVE